jgi:hypothetical protein
VILCVHLQSPAVDGLELSSGRQHSSRAAIREIETPGVRALRAIALPTAAAPFTTAEFRSMKFMTLQGQEIDRRDLRALDDGIELGIPFLI